MNDLLKEVSLTVSENSFVAIMGKSGSGKSTLLYMLSGLLTPSGGSVIYDGIDIFSMKQSHREKLRRDIFGFIFQSFNLFDNISSLDNILLPLHINHKAVDSAYIDRICRILDIEQHLKKSVNQLSGGQQQRIAIARALAIKPKVVFADEPTGNLDQENSRNVMDLLSMVQKEFGIAIVLVTHDKDIAQYAEQIIQIQDGMLAL